MFRPKPWQEEERGRFFDRPIRLGLNGFLMATLPPRNYSLSLYLFSWTESTCVQHCLQRMKANSELVMYFCERDRHPDLILALGGSR